MNKTRVIVKIFFFLQGLRLCSLKQTPFTKKETNSATTDDSSTVSSIPTTEIFDMMSQFLELQKLRDNMNLRVATTETQKKDCSLCKSKTHETAQCPDLLKAIKEATQKHTESKETGNYQPNTQNTYGNFPPPP